MIKIGTTNINKVNYQGTISKALKGTDLIWEKITFKGLDISGFGEVTINDGGLYQLPLNVPMKFTHNAAGVNVIYVISGDQEYRLFRDTTTFEIKSEKPFKLLGENSWDIKIIQSNEQPTVII